MKNLFKDFSPKDFLDVLSSPSREYAISALDANADLMQIAATLSGEPGEGLATKGGELWPSDIMPRIIKEAHLLFCADDAKYESIRDKLKGEGVTTANVIVYMVSNTVAIHAGLAAALCVPFVALLLAAMAKVSLSAWCKSVVQQAGPAMVQQAKSAEIQQTKSPEEKGKSPKDS